MYYEHDVFGDVYTADEMLKMLMDFYANDGIASGVYDLGTIEDDVGSMAFIGVYATVKGENKTASFMGYWLDTSGNNWAKAYEINKLDDYEVEYINNINMFDGINELARHFNPSDSFDMFD